MGLLDRVRSFIVRAPKTQPVLDKGGFSMGSLGGFRNLSASPIANAGMKRKWARTNEFLRTAINRRIHQVAFADWKLIRRNNPNQAPDPKVEQAVKDLLDVPNPKGESFRVLLAQVIEDILVLDAGCIEKELTLGGAIAHLWGVNGATIAPDPDWTGQSLATPRYHQVIVGQDPIPLRNDQLIYMMENPTTHSHMGWSRVDTLIRIVRAELFGEDYNYEMIRRYSPRGILDLGPGVNDTQRDAFAEYWEAEIEGTEAIAIVNGGDPNGKGRQFLELTVDDFEKRLAYMRWLATKIAAVFEMDLLVFNLSESVQKSVGKTLTARTDEGATALANLVAEYITREIIWVIDPTRNHKFAFDDLNDRDALAQAKIDQVYMSIGCTTPNEVRRRDGKDPVEWGDEPYSSTQSQFAGDDPGEGDDANDEEPGENATGKGFAARSAPFAAASTRSVKRSSTRASTRSWHAKPNASTPPSPSAKTTS